MQGKSLILLVEDSLVLQRVALAQLKQLGDVVTHVASDANQALLLVGKHDYHLILMDIHLPGADGWEITRRIRALPHRSVVPIIAVSTDESRSRSLAAGMNDHVVKPAQYAQLVTDWLARGRG